MVIGEIELY